MSLLLYSNLICTLKVIHNILLPCEFKIDLKCLKLICTYDVKLDSGIKLKVVKNKIKSLLNQTTLNKDKQKFTHLGRYLVTMLGTALVKK